ncbi:MAG: hypothetical protein ACOX1N_01320 [Candidatus Methanomethylophilaceae archaeon]
MDPWVERVGETEFSLRLFRLQDQCGLTFKEAVAVLTHHDFTDDLAEKWGVSKQAVHNASRRGYDKIYAKVGTDEMAVAEFVPLYFTQIF